MSTGPSIADLLEQTNRELAGTDARVYRRGPDLPGAQNRPLPAGAVRGGSEEEPAHHPLGDEPSQPLVGRGGDGGSRGMKSMGQLAFSRYDAGPGCCDRFRRQAAIG